MVFEIVSFLRFITDPDTRGTITAISNYVSQSRKNWRDELKTATAKFSGDEKFKASIFANHLLNDLKTLEVDSEEIEKFRLVFTELINNAFEHGCKNAKNCRVTIRCDYSRWFIRLEVSDSGKGFDFGTALSQQRETSEHHGLLVVSKSAHHFKANKKGNTLTALLVNNNEVRIFPTVQKYKGQSLLFIKVEDKSDWYYMISDWEPLKRAVASASQKLILIDCTETSWSTDKLSETKRMITGFKQQKGVFYALVVRSSIYQIFDFSNLTTENFKVFYDDLESAKQWLYEQVRKPKITES